MKKIILIILLTLKALLFSQIETSLSDAYISLGEWTTLTVKLTGNFIKLESTEVDEISMESYGQSTSYSYINGKKDKSITVNYRIIPNSKGTIKLPVFYGILEDNSKVKSEELTLYVEDAPKPKINKTRSDSEFETEHVKLYIDLAERDFYIGESIPVEISLYLSKKYPFGINRNIHVKSGSFTLDLDSGSAKENSNFILDGKMYHEAKWSAFLTPLKEGDNKLQLQVGSYIQIPDGGTGFFPSYIKEDITTSSKEITVKTLPLPLEGRPENFTGAIGDFSISSELTPVKAEIGDPLTLTIDIFGKGNFSRVEAASIGSDGDDWKQYPATSQYSGSNGSKFHGVKRFKHIISPKSDKLDSLKPFTFYFFDPESKEYKKLSTKEYKVDISKGDNNFAEELSAKREMVFIDEKPQLRHNPSPVVKEFKSLFSSILSILLLAISALLLLASLYLYLRNRNRTDPNSKIVKLKRESMKKIDGYILEKNYNGALIEYNNLILNYLSEPGGLNPKSITSQDVDITSPFYKVVKKAEAIKYSKDSITGDELDSITGKILEEIK